MTKDIPEDLCRALTRTDNVVASVIPIYRKYFSEEEIRELIAFYKTPVGSKYAKYLSPEFVETEADFNRPKKNMVRDGDVRTFENFVVAVPAGIDLTKYTAVIVWCETFGQFITAAKYR